MDPSLSLQDQFAPRLICFGCGPANQAGLQLKSFVDGDQLQATFRASPHHQAFEGILNGGIIGTLLDCHCNWMACFHMMVRDQTEVPPCTVTAEYTIEMLKPTPIADLIELRAHVVDSDRRRTTTAGTLMVNGQITAHCRGVFVAVREGHPAFHRW